MTLTQSPPETVDTLSAIEARRSVKKYDPHHVMPTEQLEQLIDLAMLSPTSFNIQNWRFVVVTDKTQRQAMQAASWGQAQVTEASAVILVCADLKAADKDPARYWVNAPQPVQDTIVPMIGQFYQNNPTLQRDEALRSVGMASQTIMLAAKAMGLDTCPMIGFDPVKMAELIRLPEDHMIGMMITVGKAIEPAKVRSGQLLRQEVMEWNTF